MSETCRDDLVSRSFLIKLIDKGVVPELLLAGKYESAGTMAGFSKVLEMKSVSPCIDAVPVVRCEHCKKAVECQLYGEHYGLPAEKGIFCEVWQTVVDKNGYCYQGVKMDATDNNVGHKDGGVSDG